MTEWDGGYKESSLNTLESVGAGIDRFLVLVPVFASRGVPFMANGEFAAVNGRSSQQVNHLDITIQLISSYNHIVLSVVLIPIDFSHLIP